jgi:hypothetical protein
MGIAGQGGIDKTALEKQWANQEARSKLSKQDRTLWDAARHTVRPYVYFDKVLIVWTAVQGQPVIKEILKVSGLETSFQDGIWLRMHAEIAGRDITINHCPRRLLPNLDIFGWVPFFNEMRYASADWDDPGAKRNLRLHTCFKMRSDSRDIRDVVEGHDYISELHVFRAIWPQYASTRF